MTVLDKIIKILNSGQVQYKLINHEATVTCEDAARVRNTLPSQGAKAIIMYADNEPILLVLPCSRKIDFGLFKKSVNIKDLRMATPDEIFRLTGLQIGSIPPAGSVLNLKTYLDQELTLVDEICFNAGAVDVSIMIKIDDYIELEKPQILSFSIPKTI